MGKGNGGTRSSSSGSPRGLQNTIGPTIPPISEAYATAIDTSIPKRVNDISESDWYSENGSSLANRVQDTIRNRVVAGDNLAVVQLSRDDSGNRAIRVLHQGNPYSSNVIARKRDRQMRTIAERIETLYNIRTRYTIENSRAAGYVGYISFLGWK